MKTLKKQMMKYVFANDEVVIQHQIKSLGTRDLIALRKQNVNALKMIIARREKWLKSPENKKHALYNFISCETAQCKRDLAEELNVIQMLENEIITEGLDVIK